MPAPLSITSITTRPSAVVPLTITDPPDGVYLIALSSTLISNCLSRSASPWTQAGGLYRAQGNALLYRGDLHQLDDLLRELVEPITLCLAVIGP